MKSKRRPAEPSTLPITPSLRDPSAEHRALTEVHLSFSCGKKTVKVWGNQVDRIALQQSVWGVRGELEFRVENDKKYGGAEKDELFTLVESREVLSVTLVIKSLRSDVDEQVRRKHAGAGPLVVQGTVFEKEVQEELPIEAKGGVVARRYCMQFADAAQVFWTQHHPVELYTQKSLREIIAAHKPAKMTVVYDGESLGKKREQIFLALENSSQRAASFYDWIMWWCERNDLAFSYQHEQGSYRIAEQPAPAPKQKHLLGRSDVSRFVLRYPEPPRVALRIRSGTVSDPRSKRVEKNEAQSPLVQDVLLRGAVSADLDARCSQETAKLRVRNPFLVVDFQQLPLRVVMPGQWVNLQESAAAFAAHGLMLPELAQRGFLRCTQTMLTLQVDSERVVSGDNGHQQCFVMRHSIQLEPSAERAVQRPPFVAPQYPRMVEGLVVAGPDESSGSTGASKKKDSAGKTEIEEVYEVEKDGTTGLLRYKLRLPGFEDQVVRAPFDPGMLSGHFYFPLYKQAKVLLAMECERASIRALLDWRVGGQLPLESHGNQLMMGKKPSSQVIVQTVYANEKITFTLRRNSGEDVQSVQFLEGELRVFVGEGSDEKAKGKIKTTTISIRKQQGVTVKVENPDGKCNQEVDIDGKSITLWVKGQKEKTSIQQTEDSVTMTGKNVTVLAETLKLSSSKASTWTCGEALSVESKGAVKLGTESTLHVTAQDTGTVSAMSLSLQAKRKARIEGLDTEIAAKKSLQHTGMNVSIEGKVSNKLSAPTVAIEASAMASLKSSGVTKVEGSLVNISGKLISIG